MKIVSIYNNKGGVGKTTTTKRLAIKKARENNNVLILDMDPQANITSQFLKEDITTSMYDVLIEKEDINNCIYSTNTNNVDIIPSKINLLKANNKIMLGSMNGLNPSTRLKKQLNKLKIKYDYIFIDCPPTMDLLVTNGLTVTDEVIIPLTVDNYSLDGINLLLEKIDEVKLNNNDNLKISGIFINRYKRSNIHNEMKSTLKELLNNLMTDVVIGDYAVINENTFTGDENKINNHKVNKQFNELFDKLGV